MADTPTAAATIKTWFETGDIPSQDQFDDFITSYQNLVDNNLLDGINSAVTAVYPASQSTATLLSNRMNIVTTAPTGTCGVKLPTASAGRIMIVVNSSSNTVNVYPQSGEYIIPVSVDSPAPVTALESIILIGNGSGRWTALATFAFDQATFSQIAAENIANKSANTSLGNSDTLFPTQKAVKTYVDAHAGAEKKIYKAFVTASGTNAPSATILENTLGFTPTWSRNSAGVYWLAYTGGFNYLKTFILCQLDLGWTGLTYAMYADAAAYTPNKLVFLTMDNFFVPVDGFGAWIEINVYP